MHEYQARKCLGRALLSRRATSCAPVAIYEHIAAVNSTGAFAVHLDSHAETSLKSAPKALGAKHRTKKAKTTKRASKTAGEAVKKLVQQAHAEAACDTACCAPHERRHFDSDPLQGNSSDSCNTAHDGITPALMAAAGQAGTQQTAQEAQPQLCHPQPPPPLCASWHISQAHYDALVPAAAAARRREAARRALLACEAHARSAQAAQQGAEATLRSAEAAAERHERCAAETRGRAAGGRTQRPQAQLAAQEKAALEEALAASERTRAEEVRRSIADLSRCAHAAQHALCAAREAEREAAAAFEAAAEPAECIPLGVLRRAVEVGLLIPAAMHA